MDALAGQRIEIDGQGGDQRLAFAGLHLGDAAFMQNHAADELHVEMTLAERALGSLADGGEGGSKEFVERLTLRELLAELRGAGLQLGVGEAGEARLQGVDLGDPAGIFPDLAVIDGAENLRRDRTQS